MTTKKYEYANPYEWLHRASQKWDETQLRNAMLLLAQEAGYEAIQENFQMEMDQDGFFAPIADPKTGPVTITGAHSHYICLNGKLLSPERSQKVYNHSPDGFSWGYAGSGPAQLALAILLECTDEDTAKYHYQAFKFDVIAKLPRTEEFEITIDVQEWLESRTITVLPRRSGSVKSA